MILVTGATGFVGRHLVRALRTHFSGKSIKIFSRTLPPPGVLPNGVEVYLGKIEDAQAAAEVVRGVEVVIHLAAQVHARDTQQMRRVNAGGTRMLYSAAVAAGSKLFVHMSSSGVYGPARSPQPFREDDDLRPATPYQLTKFEAEELLGEIDPRETTLNILRPPVIYGSGSLLAACKSVLARRWAIEPRGGVIIHPTHVRDVVEGIIALIERPASQGAVFNLGGERPILAQDLSAMVAATLGVGRRRVVLPPSVAGPLGGIAEPIFSWIGQPKPLLARMCQGQLFSAAVDDRRFRQRYPSASVMSLADGLREHIDWARGRGLL
jgi:nucleoside-diphosphate-sugar epimerase